VQRGRNHTHVAGGRPCRGALTCPCGTADCDTSAAPGRLCAILHGARSQQIQALTRRAGQICVNFFEQAIALYPS
jgi:hypothetical protein